MKTSHGEDRRRADRLRMLGGLAVTVMDFGRAFRSIRSPPAGDIEILDAFADDDGLRGHDTRRALSSRPQILTAYDLGSTLMVGRMSH
jgi:hypothetical protein